MIYRYLTTKNPSICSGCGACVARCPKKCLRLKTDQDGFYYPEMINRDACIDCELCSKVCPFENTISNEKTSHFYAAYSTDPNKINNSSSGGIFPEIANMVLADNGKVYGAYLDENHKLFHIGISDVLDLPKLLGSKYLQSDTRNTFQECKEDLQNSRLVLYTGTPCQIQGLKNYLGKEYANLYTLDVICHGVPSPKMFEGYIDFLERKHKAKLVDICFRDKKRNKWSITLRYTMEFPNGKRRNFYLISKLSEYFVAFLGGHISRESCYRCPFSSLVRPGDITMGDFWGYQATRPELRHDEGLSILLVNTEKGKELIRRCEQKGVVFNEIDENSVRQSENKNLYFPTKRPLSREMVYKELNSYGFDFISKKYFRKSQTWQFRLRNNLPREVVRILDLLRGRK